MDKENQLRGFAGTPPTLRRQGCGKSVSRGKISPLPVGFYRPYYAPVAAGLVKVIGHQYGVNNAGYPKA
jgi:hypothetical protein